MIFNLSMKKVSVILVLSFVVQICFSQEANWVSIKGFLPRWIDAEISVISNNQIIYSGKVVKDIFDYTGNVASPQQALLKLKSGKTILYIPVFLEPGTIKIRDAGGRNIVAYGTASNDTYIRLTKDFDSLTALQKINSFQDAMNYKRELATHFIQNNPASIVSLQLLKDYYYLSTQADDKIYYTLMQTLDEKLYENFYAQEMRKEAAQRFATAIGNRAPNVLVQDTSGQQVALFTKGEYTLVDFWASWCLPCRKENSELIKVLNNHKPAGFRITSVSLDNNKLLWLSAIRHDKMVWTQVSDLKGWNSPIATTYGIRVIPTNYLIDREGVIIAKNLPVEQVDKFLDTISERVNF
jgi:thiol-disulfide isomerase/thioredoxin